MWMSTLRGNKVESILIKREALQAYLLMVRYQEGDMRMNDVAKP